MGFPECFLGLKILPLNVTVKDFSMHKTETLPPESKEILT